MSLVPNSRRAAALSPVGARDCVEGQRSRKRGALHGLGGHQTRLRGPWEASHGKLGPTSTWLAGCSSNTSGRSSSLEVGWPGRREPCSRCWQQLGTGLQLARLIGTAALTARDGAGAGGAAGRSARRCAPRWAERWLGCLACRASRSCCGTYPPSPVEPQLSPSRGRHFCNSVGRPGW